MAMRRKDKSQRVKTEKSQETKGRGKGGGAGTTKMKQGLCCVYGFTVMKKYNIR